MRGIVTEILWRRDRSSSSSSLQHVSTATTFIVFSFAIAPAAQAASLASNGNFTNLGASAPSVSSTHWLPSAPVGLSPNHGPPLLKSNSALSPYLYINVFSGYLTNYPVTMFKSVLCEPSQAVPIIDSVCSSYRLKLEIIADPATNIQ